MQLQIVGRPNEVVACDQMHAAVDIRFGSMNPHGQLPYGTKIVPNAGSPYFMMLKCTHVGWAATWDPETHTWDPFRATRNMMYGEV